MEHPVNWLDLAFLYILRDGSLSEGPIESLLDGHDGDNPVVGVAGGHPYAVHGFAFFLTALLQIAAPPRNPEEAAERLFAPPTPAEFRGWLERIRPALWLTGTDTPLFQVRPTAGWEPDPQPIASLLPDTPTRNAIDKGEDFFAKRDSVRAIGLWLLPPILYAHQVLFPSAGGGYLSLPHSANAPKYAVTGDTLWRRTWANVAPTDTTELARGPWLAPCNATVFPWLDGRVRGLALDRISDNKRAALRAAGKEVPDTILELGLMDRHPAAIPMPRRYLLDPPHEGVCSLTGQPGLVVSTYQRWPQGLRYPKDGWFHPAVARQTVYSADQPEEHGFPQAGGPLRFDDWLAMALGADPSPPQGEFKGKRVLRQAPLVVRNFHRLFEDLQRISPVGTGEATALGGDLPFGVTVLAQFSYGNAVGGFSERSLPLYALPSADAAKDLATRATTMVDGIAAVAGTLRRHAAMAVQLGNADRKASVAGDLADSLMARLEPEVIDAVGRLATVLAPSDANPQTPLDVTEAIAGKARRLALAMFDDAFPVTGVTAHDKRLGEIRGKLRRALYPQPDQTTRPRKAAKRTKGTAP